MRGGTTPSAVVLGGQRIAVRRPRARDLVKRWRDGQMTLRWIASALSAAKDSLRKLREHRDMNNLITALNQRAAQNQPVERKVA